MPSGTLTLADLRANRFQSVADFGLQTIDEILQRDLVVYNQITAEVVADLDDITTDRQRIYGTSATYTLGQDSDEFDPGVAQKAPQTGVTCGFPLKKYVYAIGWTRDWFLSNTPADLAEAVLGIQRADTRTILRDIRNALFGGVNATVFDRFEPPQINLAVKALVNADSADIPNGPNGETFTGSSHTHYDYLDGTAPTAASLTALIEDVVEHGHGDGVRLYINRAAEAAVRALTGFTAYADPRMVYRSSDTPGASLDITRIDNRAIGLFGAAEVWVKPWIPAGYVFCYSAGSPKPLVMRQPRAGQLTGLRVAARLEDYPLYADQMEHYMGFGVWNRTNGAVLFYGSGASAYVAPTFSA